jgi:hypothetical protein
MQAGRKELLISFNQGLKAVVDVGRQIRASDVI